MAKREATKPEVEQFLKDFKFKMDYYGIYYMDKRAKNVQALLDLEITRNDRIGFLKDLKAEDYSETIIEKGPAGDLFVFGKLIKDTDIYIKIQMGIEALKTIMISFHEEERPMTFPYK